MTDSLKDNFTHNLLLGGAVFLISGVFFSLFYNFDQLFTQLFYFQDGGFVIGQNIIVEILRDVFKSIYVLALVITCLALLFLIGFVGKGGVKYQQKWLYVLLCLIIGPGLVTNIILKDNWGRARPVQTESFGGTKQFTPPLLPTTQCQTRNCSFVCGEASSIFAVFFAFGIISAGVFRQRFFYLALSLGALSGLVRVVQGKHFFSDVIFAGVFMWLTCLFVWWVMFILWPQRHSLFEKGRHIVYPYISAYAKI